MPTMKRYLNIACEYHGLRIATAALILSLMLANQRWMTGVAAVATTRRNVSCIPYEVQFTCDCAMSDEDLVLPPLIGSAYQLEIRNCKSFTIDSNVLRDIQHLHKITFKNVDNLVLNQYALSLPDYSSSTPLILSFEKVKVKLIDSLAINGQIEEITFVDCYLESVRPFAFNILKNNALRFTMDKVRIDRIDPQAFKKLVVEKIDIHDCVFLTNVPSKTFYDIEVTDSFLLNNVRFRTVHSKAFSFKMISKLTIANNYFEAIDAEWLEAFVKKSPQIRDNYFGNTSEISFKAIRVHRDYGSSEKMELRFSNNTIRFPYDVHPLEFSRDFTLNIKQLNYDNPYPCTDYDTNLQPPRPRTEFFNHYQHNIYFRPDAEASGPPSNGQQQITSKNNFKALHEILAGDCNRFPYWIYIIIGMAILIVVIALILIIACWHVSKKRRAKRKMDIIQPEPRTYKETQIVYQIENAGLLKTDF
uniref:Uncharacterized protein n=1 Tax=Stomoxys calcitrans TaxID=35570 RepID=A0A1I8P1W3_STOCA